MANKNIYIHEEDQSQNFIDINGNVIGTETDISPELSPRIEVTHNHFKYESNTKAAADYNTKKLQELSLRKEAGTHLIMRYPFVFNGLELPTKKVLDNRADPIPFCIEGAYPSVKAINMNKDAPGAFYLVNDDDRIGHFRTKIPRQIIKNLLISSKSAGIRYSKIQYQVGLENTHFVGCEIGLHIDHCYTIALQLITYAETCKIGFLLDNIGVINLGSIRSLSCDIGANLIAVGHAYGQIVCEHCKDKTFVIDWMRNSKVILYHEGSSTGELKRCRYTDFRIHHEHIPITKIDQETLDYCTFNGERN